MEWIEATFRMKSDAGVAGPDVEMSWTFRGPCPGTPVSRASFRRVGGELLAIVLLRPPISEAFRVALRFNPISFLSQHNPNLRKLLEPFTQVTPVDFRVHPPVC